MALNRPARASAVAAALCSAPLVVSPARGADGTKNFIAIGTLVCTERSMAEDVVAIISDPDAENPVRRLNLILSSGGCSDHLAGGRYDPGTVSEAGILSARIHGFGVYMVTLTATGNRLPPLQEQVGRTPAQRPHRLLLNERTSAS